MLFSHLAGGISRDLNNYRNSELFKDVWSKTKILFNKKPEAWSTKKLMKYYDKYYKKRTKHLSKLLVGLHGYFSVFNS